MGYLPPVRNDQYIQYANRSISQKSNYAYIQKTANIPSERAYREVEKERKIRLRLLGGSRKKSGKKRSTAVLRKRRKAGASSMNPFER